MRRDRLSFCEALSFSAQLADKDSSPVGVCQMVGLKQNKVASGVPLPVTVFLQAGDPPKVVSS